MKILDHAMAVRFSDSRELPRFTEQFTGEDCVSKAKEAVERIKDWPKSYYWRKSSGISEPDENGAVVNFHWGDDTCLVAPYIVQWWRVADKPAS